MVFHWDEYWGIGKWIVLHSDSVEVKVVWVYKGVLNFLTHSYELIKYKDCCL